MDLGSNNMLTNLLPLLLNRSGQSSNNNNMLAMLLPLLMQRSGSNASSSELLKSLLPMMSGSNPNIAQILNALNSSNNPSEQESYKDDEPIEINPQNIRYNPSRRKVDFSKLYPDLENIDIHTMPKIEDYNKEQAKSNVESNSESPNIQNNNGAPNNSLITLLTLLQNLRKPNNVQEKITAIDGIAPPKIKKSLKAILALNSIINE